MMTRCCSVLLVWCMSAWLRHAGTTHAVPATLPTGCLPAAGLLLSGSEDASERPRPGATRSAVLLLGRLLLALLFVFVGVAQVRPPGGVAVARPPPPPSPTHPRTLPQGAWGKLPTSASASTTITTATPQVRRIGARDYSLFQSPQMRASQHWGVRDGHDNNLLLLECALAPFLAVGLATDVVSRLLCGVLLLEALTCWPFWAGYWPSWHYRWGLLLGGLGAGTTRGRLEACSCLLAESRRIHARAVYSLARPAAGHCRTPAGLPMPGSAVDPHSCSPPPAATGLTCGCTSSSTWRRPAGCCCCRALGPAPSPWTS